HQEGNQQHIPHLLRSSKCFRTASPISFPWKVTTTFPFIRHFKQLIPRRAPFMNNSKKTPTPSRPKSVDMTYTMHNSTHSHHDNPPTLPMAFSRLNSPELTNSWTLAKKSVLTRKAIIPMGVYSTLRPFHQSDNLFLATWDDNYPTIAQQQASEGKNNRYVILEVSEDTY